MNDECEESEGGEIVSASQMQALMRAEIDTQIATAKAYPRSLKTFKKRALDMATLDEETASSCMFALPRGGKTIQGPSVRLAEIVASAWGNLRYGSRIVNDDGKIVTAQGACHDLETNVASTIETGRRVTDKRGKRYNDDMIVMTQNAASSIAIRNAIFKVIPMAYVREIYLQARQVAIGNADTLASRRDAAMDYFKKVGIPLDRVLAVVGKSSVEDVGLDELATLKGIASAIKNGEISADEAFPEPAKSSKNGAQSRADALKSKLNGSNGKTETKSNGTSEPGPAASATAAAAPPVSEGGKAPDSQAGPGGASEAAQSSKPLPEAATRDPELAFDDFKGRIEACNRGVHLERVSLEIRDAKAVLGDTLFGKLAEMVDARSEAIAQAANGGNKK